MRRVYAWTLLLLGGLAVLLGGLHGYVGIRERLIERDFAQMQRAPEREQLDWLSQQASGLTELMPWSADLHDLDGRIAAFVARVVELSPREEVQYWRKARASFVKSLERRARWPYSWLSLAEAELALDPRSARVEFALRRAFEIGIRGNSAQLQLLAIRERLSTAMQSRLSTELDRMLQTALNDDAPVIMDALQRRGLLAWACELKQAPALARQICEQSFDPPPSPSTP
jgi:hypothetical protein